MTLLLVCAGIICISPMCLETITEKILKSDHDLKSEDDEPPTYEPPPFISKYYDIEDDVVD